MNLDTFTEGLRNGNISIDMMGHYPCSEEELKRRVLRRCDRYRPFYQEQLEKDQPENCDTYHDHCRKALERADSDDLIIVSDTVGLPNTFDCECGTCGEQLWLFLKDEKTIILGHWNIDRPEQAKTCIFADGIKPMTENIEFPTGKVLFANYFTEFRDEPEDMEYSQEYSLNLHIGRQRIMGHLAEQNVGYGQYGNMSVSIYASPDRKRVVVLSTDTDALADDIRCYEEDGEEVPETKRMKWAEYCELRESGYQYLGEISLGVWRVMCADMATLEAANFEEKDDMDYVQADVVPGTWNMTQYYRSGGPKGTIIGSSFDLVE